jgi:ribonuclease HI
MHYFTDDSSFGVVHIFGGYVAVALDTIIEARLLPVGTSAQKAELIALTQMLQLAAGVLVNIYTDSKYAFTTICVHGALYKERGIINLVGKSVKYGQEILELLEAVWAPKQVAVMHCRRHQKGGDNNCSGKQKS